MHWRDLRYEWNGNGTRTPCERYTCTWEAVSEYSSVFNFTFVYYHFVAAFDVNPQTPGLWVTSSSTKCDSQFLRHQTRDKKESLSLSELTNLYDLFCREKMRCADPFLVFPVPCAHSARGSMALPPVKWKRIVMSFFSVYLLYLLIEVHKRWRRIKNQEQNTYIIIVEISVRNLIFVHAINFHMAANKQQFVCQCLPCCVQHTHSMNIYIFWKKILIQIIKWTVVCSRRDMHCLQRARTPKSILC